MPMLTTAADALTAVILACSDYETVNVSVTIGEEAFRDAVICAYTDRQGLTLPGFGAIVLLGVVNLPIYIRQESVLMPFVLSVILSGVLLSSTSGFVQGLVVLVVLMVVGLGPVLLLRTVDRN